MADEVLAENADDAAAASTAQRVLGLALRYLRDLRSSTRHFVHAIDLAVANDLGELAGLARMSMCGNLAEAGRFDEAIALADRAASDLHGYQAARAKLQKATIHMVRGDWPEAIAGFSDALPEIESAGPTASLADLYGNRGLVLLRQGHLQHAEQDLLAARALHGRLGNTRSAVDVLKNLGMSATTRGDLPLALARYQEADEILSDLGIVDAMGLMHRAHGLLGARLLEEAQEAISRALRGFEEEGVEARTAEAFLYQADIHLAARDPEGALRAASAARRLLTGQRRAAFAPLADYADLRAQVALDPAKSSTLR